MVPDRPEAAARIECVMASLVRGSNRGPRERRPRQVSGIWSPQVTADGQPQRPRAIVRCLCDEVLATGRYLVGRGREGVDQVAWRERRVAAQHREEAVTQLRRDGFSVKGRDRS